MTTFSPQRLARRAVPQPLLMKSWEAYCRWRARAARRAFDAAPAGPAWLGMADLARLQTRYPADRRYHYDAATLRARGERRAGQLLRLLPKERGLTRFLDLGAWDGVNALALAGRGKRATSVDIRAEGYTAVARAGDVDLLQMNVDRLGFLDGAFDVLFSYNSFEHFLDPAAVLAEAWRVLRPGGYLYLNFGPLYDSPKGAHLFKTITVPYCQHLFRRETLIAFAAAEGLELTDFKWMNEWSLGQYRCLWDDFADRLAPIRYYETYNARHVDLIARYPACFRSKTDDFDSLLVSNIEALFQKRER